MLLTPRETICGKTVAVIMFSRNVQVMVSFVAEKHFILKMLYNSFSWEINQYCQFLNFCHF